MSDDATPTSDGTDVPNPDVPETGESPQADVIPDALGGSISPIEIQDEMERSFLEYSMSVIMSRALPDVRDGLKPVHRRILWDMENQNFRPDRPFVKCARVTGDTMARFHPHGNSAIYDALARMAQPFSLRNPLIDFHGNYGSPDQPPAAERYTECRLSSLAMQMLASIDENTVNFTANYDGTTEEPVVLPARFPNLLVNGSQGIAVGMATNIPPHNLVEVIDATTHLIDNPYATADDLMQFIKGPDFPTGGFIMGRTGIVDAYRTGRGSVKMRASASIEEIKKDIVILVTEIPYQTSVGAIAGRIAELVTSKELDGIRAINDESAGVDTRLVITLKRDANANVVLNNLYKMTQMQSTFSINMVAIDDGVPRTLNLVQVLTAYVGHQVEVITRRTQYRLDKAKNRAHILEGLIRALDMIDAIIALIRGSDDRTEARESLMADPFLFSEIQANHILDLRLAQLTKLSRADLEEELAKLREAIAELEAILNDDSRLRDVIKSELAEVRTKFGSPRRAKITHDVGEISIEDLVDDKELVVVMTKAGYIKTVDATAFKTQGRGGRGVSGAKLKEEDLVTRVVHTTAHAFLLLFSNRGKVYRLKTHEIPERERTAKGLPIVNLLPLQPNETIEAVIDTRDYETSRYLFFCTRLGHVKKTLFSEYDSSRRDGLIALNLKDGDELVKVIQTSGSDDIFMVSRKGMTIRFTEDDVRPMGRSASGVIGMRMKAGDEVVSCDVARDDVSILTVTESGYAKRTEVDKFTRQGRGGQGVIGMRLTAKKGYVASAFMVGADDEVFAVSSSGVSIRLPVNDISSQGRDATGVRMMALDDGQIVAAVALILASDDAADDEADA